MAAGFHMGHVGPAKLPKWVFDRKFLQTIITRVDDNDEISKRILDDEDFRATLGEF